MIKEFGLLLLSLFGIIQADFPKADRPEPSSPLPKMIISEGISAKSVLVYDFVTGEKIVEKETGEILPIASLTKAMTADIALRYFDLGSKIKISREALKTPGEVGAFYEGENFLLRDLLSAMMISSSNGAAMAVAEAVGERLGGKIFTDKIEYFVEEMNREARELGMVNTFFTNPTGLDFDLRTPSNFSTANDLLKLVRNSNSLIWEFSRDKEKIIYSLEGKNHLIENTNGVFDDLPYGIGGKTGSTDQAGESLVLLYEYPLGKQGALLLLGSREGRRVQEARSLLGQIMTMLR